MTPNSILFVCLGNICRSPIAEGVANRIAKERELNIKIESRGTSGWHSGEPPCLPAIKTAKSNGIDISEYRSQQVSKSDLEEFDLIIALDAQNFLDLKELGAKNLKKLGEFGLNSEDIPDPYYFTDEDGFKRVFSMIEKGVTEILHSAK